MTDSPVRESSVEQTWLASGRALAAAAGALVGLIALLFDVSVLVAIGRGAIAFVGVRVVVAAGDRALRVLLRARARANG